MLIPAVFGMWTNKIAGRSQITIEALVRWSISGPVEPR